MFAIPDDYNALPGHGPEGGEIHLRYHPEPIYMTYHQSEDSHDLCNHII